MFLSRISLDRYNRNTLKALNSPSMFHGAIEHSFEDGGKRKLWRVDCIGNQLYLLLLSECKPELSLVCSQFGYKKSSYETKIYDGLLDRIKTGDKWRFRLTANPTKSITSKEMKERGKIVANITTDFQKEWLIKKSEKNGFFVTENSFDIVQNRRFKFFKKENKLVSLFSATYEGILEVTDADLFRNALVNGIGRGKAYGMGLLTIMKV